MDVVALDCGLKTAACIAEYRKADAGR